MHDVGVAVVAALQQEFPDLDITGREQDYGNRLGVAFRLGDRRLLAYTPDQIDYRRFSAARWLHRFRDIIVERLK